MPKRLAPAFGVAVLAAGAWTAVVGAVDLLGRVDESEALAYGLAIFVLTWVGTALIRPRRPDDEHPSPRPPGRARPRGRGA